MSIKLKGYDQASPPDAITNPPPYTRPIPQKQLPMPREFNGKKYYGTEDVARIIGVTQKTVWTWQNKLFMGAPIFTADERAHDGRYLYEVERVMQLKSVYRPDWNESVYLEHADKPAPTTSYMAVSFDTVFKLNLLSPATLDSLEVIQATRYSKNKNFRNPTHACCPFCGSSEMTPKAAKGQVTQ